MQTEVRPVGTLLREWRQRRRLRQPDLAERLEVPLRERNALLLAAHEPRPALSVADLAKGTPSAAEGGSRSPEPRDPAERVASIDDPLTGRGRRP